MYIDKCLQMGCSESCRIFETFSCALEWVAGKKLGIHRMTHILDDFFIVNPSKTNCQKDLRSFTEMCKQVQVPLAADKTFGPSTVMSFVGYEIDSINSEVRLPDDKVEKCATGISSLIASKKTTLRELQSLIGLLNFACGVIVPGRAFLRRLIDLTIGVKMPFHRIRITQEVKSDLQVWLQFLTEFNGKYLFRTEMFLSPSKLHLFTDAAKRAGFAAVFQSRWFCGKWGSWWTEQNITLLEFVPIVLALEVWGDLFRNAVVILHTDNEALVSVINKQSSKETLVMKLVRRLVRATLNFNILCLAEHVPGEKNAIADSLSRLQVDRFRALHPHADRDPTPFPTLPSDLKS